MKSKNENQPGGEILLYQTEDGKTRLEVQFQGDTVWLSQAQMFALIQVFPLHARPKPEPVSNIVPAHQLPVAAPNRT